MKIKLVTVGKLKEKYLKDGIAEYMKRLNRFCKVEMVELADEKTPDKASDLENQQILEKEGNKIFTFFIVKKLNTAFCAARRQPNK